MGSASCTSRRIGRPVSRIWAAVFHIAMLGLGKSSLGKFIHRAILILFIEMRYAVKAIQKSRVRDYETF